ncbi:MAG: hypothetical protein ACI33J_12480 [Clostridium sp.]
MDEKIIEKHLPALYDRMIDHVESDKDSRMTKIIINYHNKLVKKSVNSECILRGKSTCNNIINAHSIQNNGVLSKLGENGKVIYIEGQIYNISEMSEMLIGRNEATTFRGLCKRHDEIFNPIEHKDYEYGNLEQNFLFAYRAFAKAYTDYFNSKNYYDSWIEELVENKSLERILEKHAESNLEKRETREIKKKVVLERQKYRVKQMQVIEKEHLAMKTAMNIYLKREKYNKLETVVKEVKVNNIIASSSLVYIYSDLNGFPFNKHLKYPTFITIHPQDNKTLVLLSYFKKDKSYFQKFINQIKNVNKEQQELIISNILLKYGSNIVFSPKEFRKFSKKNLKIIEYALNNRTQYPGEKLITYPINLFRPN